MIQTCLTVLGLAGLITGPASSTCAERWSITALRVSTQVTQSARTIGLADSCRGGYTLGQTVSSSLPAPRRLSSVASRGKRSGERSREAFFRTDLALPWALS